MNWHYLPFMSIMVFIDVITLLKMIPEIIVVGSQLVFFYIFLSCFIFLVNFVFFYLLRDEF